MEFILPTVFIICVLFLIIWGKQRKRKSLEWRRKNNTVEYVAPITYGQLLARKEWKEKRAKIMTRDNNCCCYCKSRHNLQVHHKYYLQYPNHEKVLPWEYKDDALITLCDKCHKRWHEKHTVKTYYVSRYYQSPLQEN